MSLVVPASNATFLPLNCLMLVMSFGPIIASAVIEMSSKRIVLNVREPALRILASACVGTFDMSVFPPANADSRSASVVKLIMLRLMPFALSKPFAFAIHHGP